VEPPQLAQLLEFAERPRIDDWSLRAALTRYAQPQPQRVSDLLDLVRRIEFAMGPHRDALEREGPQLWLAVQSSDAGPGTDRLVGLLRAMTELDRVGDALAAWAADPSGPRPDQDVDIVTQAVGRRLDDLGIPHEERQPPSRARG
jgi:hypothetical protein